jgi:hypothetical protein
MTRDCRLASSTTARDRKGLAQRCNPQLVDWFRRHVASLAMSVFETTMEHRLARLFFLSTAIVDYCLLYVFLCPHSLSCKHMLSVHQSIISSTHQCTHTCLHVHSTLQPHSHLAFSSTHTRHHDARPIASQNSYCQT